MLWPKNMPNRAERSHDSWLTDSVRHSIWRFSRPTAGRWWTMLRGKQRSGGFGQEHDWLALDLTSGQIRSRGPFCSLISILLHIFSPVEEAWKFLSSRQRFHRMRYKPSRIVIERFWGLLCGTALVSSIKRNSGDSTGVWRDIMSARQLYLWCWRITNENPRERRSLRLRREGRKKSLQNRVLLYIFNTL